MLNVPETVKALFKADGIRKNFRVQFPGGELPDITNDNIVQESVKFTESLCSQDVLKFGLSEASVIEFETVGIGNMYGMTIECGIEIDLSSLSAAEIAEIAAGSWDGVYVSESDTDIGYPFFRVPYGIYFVESCPRDHQAMTHRRVKAYSKNSMAFTISPVESFKLRASLSKNESFPAGVKKLIYANIGFWDTSKIAEAGYELTKICDMSQNKTYISTVYNTITVQVSPVENPSVYDTFSITLNMKQIHINGTASTQRPTPDRLYNLDGEDYFNAKDSAVNTLNRYFILRQVISVTTGEVKQFGGWESMLNYYGKGGCSYIIDREYNETVEEYIYRLSSPHTNYSQSISCFYPTRGLTLIPYEPGYYDAVISFVSKISASKGGMVINLNPDMSKVILNEWVDSGTDVEILLKATASDGGKNSFVDSYDIKELLQGYLEYNALFAKSDRAGALVLTRLDDSVAESVIPGIYSEFWWDEYDVEPIGTVTITYQDEDNKENKIDLIVGSGLSRYDMSKNEVLRNITNTDLTTISSLINLRFTPYIGSLAFTPIELDMKGLPYMEAGDYLAVTTEDGETAYSFNMRQEISGVQVLEAHVESTSGEIIESEAGT